MKMIGMALALCCSAAVAKTPAPAKASPGDAAIIGQFHEWLARSFQLPRDLPLDPGLRAAAEEMRAQHLARVDNLMLSWLREERQQKDSSGKPASPNAVYFATWARMFNELALWQVEPGDPAYEKATLAVLESTPEVCESMGDPRFTDFSSRMRRVQAAPPAQRAAMLASERTLLAHWGQPWPAPAPLPETLPQDAAVQVIKRLQADGTRPAVALSPMLASALLAEKKDIAREHPDTRCALQQWWLRLSLKQGSTPAAALAAFRYGTMITARERLAGVFESHVNDDEAPPPAPTPGARPPYPKIAERFDVTGVTTMSYQRDWTGNPTHPSVIGRQIKVAGIRGVWPVAFEDLFDKPSLEYALLAAKSAKPGGPAPSRFQMVWTLDSSTSKTGGHQ